MKVWTEDREERLKVMWAKGVSSTLIAAALGDGITKNMVLSKAHRMKLGPHLNTTTVNERKAAKAGEAPLTIDGKLSRRLHMHLHQQGLNRKTMEGIMEAFAFTGVQDPKQVAKALNIPTFEVQSALSTAEDRYGWQAA